MQQADSDRTNTINIKNKELQRIAEEAKQHYEALRQAEHKQHLLQTEIAGQKIVISNLQQALTEVQEH